MTLNHVRAWSQVRAIRNSAMRTGLASGYVDNVGMVRIECVKQLVFRRHGESTRNRFTYFLDGERVKERTVWGMVGACPL